MGMLKRLLFILLIVGLAAPAIAMPDMRVADSSTATMSHCDSHEAGGKHDGTEPANMAKHECIGCIAPIASFFAPESTALKLAAAYGLAGNSFPLLLKFDPDTPPPRA